MACRGCKDPNISDEYLCSACLIQRQEFKWCVITKADNSDGNQFDDVVIMNHDGEFRNLRDDEYRLGGAENQYVCAVPRQVFELGEVFAIDPWFEREIGCRGRKPGKWYVEYETFPAHNYQGALLKSLEVLKEK